MINPFNRNRLSREEEKEKLIKDYVFTLLKKGLSEKDIETLLVSKGYVSKAIPISKLNQEVKMPKEEAEDFEDLDDDQDEEPTEEPEEIIEEPKPKKKVKDVPKPAEKQKITGEMLLNEISKLGNVVNVLTQRVQNLEATLFRAGA